MNAGLRLETGTRQVASDHARPSRCSTLAVDEEALDANAGSDGVLIVGVFSCDGVHTVDRRWGHRRYKATAQLADLPPNGPPALTSARYAADYNEVKAIGKNGEFSRARKRFVRRKSDPCAQKTSGKGAQNPGLLNANLQERHWRIADACWAPLTLRTMLS